MTVDGVELVVTRGLPGCGKSRMARLWVAEDAARRARVNRDDVRAMLHGGRLGTSVQERQVTVVCHGAVLDLLRQDISVVVDDTNLVDEHLAALWDIAVRVGAAFRVVDMTSVPLEVCVRRDAWRSGSERVGRHVIEEMHRRHLAGRRRPLPLRGLTGALLETR